MEWTEERTTLLRTLWLQGQTASQIAERLGGVTRNAVIGKAHRLGLSSRPSPIRQRPAARPATQAPAAASAPRVHAPDAASPQPAGPGAADGAGAERTVKAAPGSRACMWRSAIRSAWLPISGRAGGTRRPYCAGQRSVPYHRKATPRLIAP